MVMSAGRTTGQGGYRDLRDRSWVQGSLLASLHRPQREVLFSLGTLRQFGPGELLLIEGDRSDFVVLLLDGFVKITSTTPDGREALLAIRMAGDLVGELAALDGRPRLATASAGGAVLARVISARDFADCLHRHPPIAAGVNRVVTAKLRMSTQRRVDFGGREAKVRLARVLMEIYGGSSGGAATDGRLGVILTQSELAGLIGASEPTVHKALRALREDGVIDTGYRQLVIRDVDALRAVAGTTRPS
jgi:CRP-like cAMP-binding protein